MHTFASKHLKATLSRSRKNVCAEVSRSAEIEKVLMMPNVFNY
jgi:hypothetical protein